jgi:hypothetical protein
MGERDLTSARENGVWIPEYILAVAAVVLFVPLFVFRRLGPLDFWWWMTAAIGLLIGGAVVLDRDYVRSIRADLRSEAARKIFWGILSAAALYALFFAGNWASRLIFPFAGRGIGDVYGFKAGVSPFRIVVLMVLIIGPGEELFWRGFLQRRWQARFGPPAGLIAAALLYTLVHAGSGNPMLVLAAAVCGLYWGILYLGTGSVLLVAVSHTLWDLAVFVFFPFG